jgi:hypothetical protein
MFPFAARRSVVARGRIVDTEEVMQGGPDVTLTMTRLALADMQDDHASPLAAYLRRLHRERQPEAPVEVYPAHDRLERPGQPVRAEAPEHMDHAPSWRYTRWKPARLPTKASMSLRTGGGVTTS